MTDVFVSYSKEDRPYAEEVIAALKAAGFSVWWDDAIETQSRWDAEIERQIEMAKAVLVLWTPRSVAIDSFVRNEADFAKQHGKLVTAILAGCDPPLAFRLVQSTNLRAWNRRNVRSIEWQKTVKALGKLVGREPLWPPPYDLDGSIKDVFSQRGKWLDQFHVKRYAEVPAAFWHHFVVVDGDDHIASGAIVVGDDWRDQLPSWRVVYGYMRPATKGRWMRSVHSVTYLGPDWSPEYRTLSDAIFARSGKPKLEKFVDRQTFDDD